MFGSGQVRRCFDILHQGSLCPKMEDTLLLIPAGLLALANSIAPKSARESPHAQEELKS